jgi:hypothetical protein
MEKFMLRVQWALPVTEEIKELCAKMMASLRTQLPLIRAIRVDIRHRERVVEHVEALEAYCADPKSERCARQLEPGGPLADLGIRPPPEDASPSAQHLHVMETASMMREAHGDLHHELARTTTKLAADIEAFEREAGHPFTHRGQKYKGIVAKWQRGYAAKGFSGRDGEAEGDLAGARPRAAEDASAALDVEGWARKMEETLGVPDRIRRMATRASAVAAQ